MIVANPKTLVELGPVFESHELQLCLLGLLLVGSLMYHNIQGSILMGIAILTMTSWTLEHGWPSSVFEWPSIPTDDFWNPGVLWDTSKASVIFPAISAFVLICVFDISGVMYGLATLGNLRQNDEIPGASYAFYASAVGTVVAAWCGSTPIIVCVETAAGVKEGGRTGLTSVIIGLYFLLSLFLAPLFGSVPEVATSPVLVLVGVLMMSESAKIKWDNMNEALPAFLTLLLMPLTYSITNGMIFGLAAAAGFYITTGQFYSDLVVLYASRRIPRDVEEEQALNGDVEQLPQRANYAAVVE
jgi:AGZA family xanthine/uracil permease-like MFS transporter